MSDTSVVVVGAGLVGALTAISFARQGYEVSLYESRSDPRIQHEARNRSINLAVSARGIAALHSVDPVLCTRILQASIPMKGRMIHHNGQQQSQIYGLFGETINSIDRSRLNLDLLDEAEGYSNIKLAFNHRLIGADFDRRELSFEANGPEIGQACERFRVKADLTIGCDGAFSAVRAAMMKVQRIDFQQEFIEHAYIELSILPSSDGEYQLDPNHLHIWPRQEFMLIALPNPDKSFTSTLFAPFHLFESLQSSEDVVKFFENEFPDALGLINAERLISIWQNNIISPLVQIKCSPYHYKDRAILLGDASHAMVPFYGQGMNCGFEDLRVLNSILERHNVTSTNHTSRGDALKAYSVERHDDLIAILRLAMDNYIEMRSRVTSKAYLLRKAIDGVLGRIFRDKWIPMYSMVSFRDDLSYSHVLGRERVQDQLVRLGLGASCLIASLMVVRIVSGGSAAPFMRTRLKNALHALARML